MTTSLALAAPGPVTASPAARTITGLAVPYGPAGQTSQGRLTFATGSLRWTDPRRVKLLREHDQRDVVGHATELRETPDGLVATFTVPPGPAGDAALTEAAHGLRDAFSVGVQLDDVVGTRLRRAQGAPVAGAGALREVSLVSVPAFDDARVGAVAARADLVVSSWGDPAGPDPVTSPDPDPVTDPGPDPSGDPDVTTAPPAPAPAPTPAPTTGAPAPAPVTTAAASSSAAPGPAAGTPSPAPLAVAGAALVTGHPSTYRLDGSGPSLARDAYYAGVHHDSEAAGRLARYNAELADGNAASHLALAAVVTRDDANAQVVIPAPSVRPLVQAVDVGRPIASRLNRTPIANAQPFLVPIEGEFSGVDLHTEGTPHVPEGTFTLTEATVAPRAVSGAFRVSRELIDSTNPAIDRLAVSAMLRDYRRVSEGRVVTALLAAATSSATVSDVNGLRAELVTFLGDDDTPADLVVAGRGFWSMLASDTDADGRPMLAYVGPTNSPGTVRAGWTGATVDGVELVRASSVAAGDAWVLDADAVLFAESATQTFRFDEVEGPGIIKLALWGYVGVAVVRPAGVRRLTVPAPATP